MKNLGCALIVAAAILLSVGARAAGYPNKAITLIVPYSAGGASDLAGRALAQTARPYLGGAPVVVVNKTGNGGMTGARFVTQAAPDGYTLLLARVGMALYPAVHKDSTVGWDGYTFLGALETTPMILCVAANSPYKTVQDLIKAFKDNQLTYGASGATAIDGFTVQALLSDVGLNPLTAATLVPYRGGGALATALLGGHVDFLAIAAGSLMPHIKAEKMRALMVYAPRRMAELPNVPTAAELGFERAGQVAGWSALYGPPNLGSDVVTKWRTVLDSLSQDQEWLTLARRRGSISTIGTGDLRQYARSQYDLYNTLARDFGYFK